MNVLVLIVLYLALVFAVPLALSGAIGWRGLPRGQRCAGCASETVPLQSRGTRLASRLMPRSTLEKRWCMQCGWTGLVRMPRGRLPSVRRSVDAFAPLRPVTRTLSVRTLTIDGASYRVLLQCWQQAGGHYGRLVFVDPVGRLWLDTVQPIGRLSVDDAVRQARDLPVPLLASRLRHVAER
ncbi:MAG: hypothetical protein ACYC28_14525 [Longimicrobiales bacterium]